MTPIVIEEQGHPGPPPPGTVGGSEPPIPELVGVAYDLWLILEPLAYADADNGYALAHFCEAVGGMLQQVHDLAYNDDAGNPGWSSLFDPDRIPDEQLQWTGQLVGVTQLPGQDEDQLRQAIRDKRGYRRGTLAAIIGETQEILHGSKTVYIGERDTSAWHFRITTFGSETPDATPASSADEKWNLVHTPSFEGGTIGQWIDGPGPAMSFGANQDWSLYGDWSLRAGIFLTAATSTFLAANNDSSETVVPGATYYARADIHLHEDLPADGGKVYLNVNWHNASDVFISQTVTQLVSYDLLADVADYTLQQEMVAPAGATKARVYVGFQTGPTDAGFDVGFDGVMLHKGTAVEFSDPDLEPNRFTWQGTVRNSRTSTVKTWTNDSSPLVTQAVNRVKPAGVMFTHAITSGGDWNELQGNHADWNEVLGDFTDWNDVLADPSQT